MSDPRFMLLEPGQYNFSNLMKEFDQSFLTLQNDQRKNRTKLLMESRQRQERLSLFHSFRKLSIMERYEKMVTDKQTFTSAKFNALYSACDVTDLLDAYNKVAAENISSKTGATHKPISYKEFMAIKKYPSKLKITSTKTYSCPKILEAQQALREFENDVYFGGIMD